MTQTEVRPRVLVASADGNLLDRLSRLLRAEDYRVAGTARGGRLLYRALEDPFDLVIMDLDLEDLDGREALQILRRARPDLPIVVLSRGLGERDLRLVAGEHVVHHFQKPVNLGDLTSLAGQITREMFDSVKLVENPGGRL